MPSHTEKVPWSSGVTSSQSQMFTLFMVVDPCDQLPLAMTMFAHIICFWCLVALHSTFVSYVVKPYYDLMWNTRLLNITAYRGNIADFRLASCHGQKLPVGHYYWWLNFFFSGFFNLIFKAFYTSIWKKTYYSILLNGGQSHLILIDFITAELQEWCDLFFGIHHFLCCILTLC